MKISNAARLIFWVAAIFTIGFLVRAESGEKRGTSPNTKTGLLRIVDQYGRPMLNGVRSPSGQIVDVTVGPDLAFHPDSINISVGETVRWTWAGGGHSVTSGRSCTADGLFCSPNNTNCGQCTTSIQGFVYEFTFTQAGSFFYFCCVHCSVGMTGVVNVSGSSPTPTATPTTTATATATATATVTATATATVTPTGTPGVRTIPTPRPRPTPVPRP